MPAALGVFDAVLLSTRERRRDPGTLKSIGMTPRQVAVMTVPSVAGVGVVSGLVGTPWGSPRIGCSWTMSACCRRSAGLLRRLWAALDQGRPHLPPFSPRSLIRLDPNGRAEPMSPPKSAPMSEDNATIALQRHVTRCATRIATMGVQLLESVEPCRAQQILTVPGPRAAMGRAGA
ncbi:FtsX-like permease family protein [Streptomyces sp. NPDC097727]|uniref:FtsX-like permease family protein n=1 Tax=Streptomyces sp. NPDC097727 TaxID=3366092 RepID=UPI003803E6B4